MPFTVDVDFYHDVLHCIACGPDPAASRRLEREILRYLHSFPPEQAERWWRAWYHARVEHPELSPHQRTLGDTRTITMDPAPAVDVERWEAVTRAAVQIANAFLELQNPWKHALPIVDLWLGWRETPDGPRFVASFDAGWEPGPPRLFGRPDPVRG